jgi:hypothetical protein
MKRTKMIISSGLIAIAIIGAFATKANTRKATVYYYNTNNLCVSEVFTPTCSGTGAQCTDGVHPIFSGISGSTCINAIPKS